MGRQTLQRPGGVTIRPSPRRRRTRDKPRLLPLYTGLVIAYLFIPVVVMIVFGFNDYEGKFNLEWRRFTLEHYKALSDYPDLFDSLRVSLQIGVVTMLVSTLLGTLLALALTRYGRRDGVRFRGRSGINLFIFLPMATPEVVMGSALLAYFVTLTLDRGFATVLIAHVMFSLSYVVVTVKARTSGMDRSLEDAAQDLGATPWVTFWTVTFPLIFPGILAASLMALVLSFDDYVITSFVSGNLNTLPLWIYGASRFELPAQVNIVGTMTFGVGLVYVIFSILRGMRSDSAPPPVLTKG